MYQIKRTQLIKTDLQTCWNFFSTHSSLQKITPKSIGFEVLMEGSDKIYEGMMAEYKMRPLLGIPMRWVTEIKSMRDKCFFIDEQRTGPYKIWHHEHHFKEVAGGVEMTDIVSYELPFGFVGRLFHRLLVKNKLEEIFAHRFKVVDELFS